MTEATGGYDRDQQWRAFLDLCLEMSDQQALDQLLYLFLTYEERNDLVNRFLIVKELLRGDKTQRQIAKELNVSIVKITRGSNFLKALNPEFKDYLKQWLT